MWKKHEEEFWTTSISGIRPSIELTKEMEKDHFFLSDVSCRIVVWVYRNPVRVKGGVVGLY